MPDDLRERLREFVPPPPEAALTTLDELPESKELSVRETERAAPHDLQAVLRLVEAGKLSVSPATRRPSSASTQLLADALVAGEPYPDESGLGPMAAFAWPLLVQAGGLAELCGSRLALTRSGSKALAALAGEVIRTLWRRWLTTRMLDELARIDAIKGQTGKGKRGLTAVAGRREAIADALVDCPVGQWVEVDELFRYMRAAGHDFAVTRDYWRLYICSPEYGSLGYDDCGGWEILEARYALCLLFEYAATLGLIDIAYVAPADARPDFHHLWGADGLEYLSRYDGLSYIRVNALGEYCLGGAEAYEPRALQARPALSVLPNLDIVATGAGLTYADRLAIERFAQRTADHVWRLERDRLLAAAESGQSITEIREFLAARSVGPLPPSVTDLLAETAQRAQRFVDRGSMRVIDCADPALVVRLANDAKTRRLCIAAGDNRLLVPTGSEEAFRRAVRRLGYAVQAGERPRAAA